MRLVSTMINSVARNAAAAAVLGILFTFGIVLSHGGDAGQVASQPHVVPSGPVVSHPGDDQWSAVLSRPRNHPGSAGDGQTDSDDQWV